MISLVLKTSDCLTRQIMKSSKMYHKNQKKNQNRLNFEKVYNFYDNWYIFCAKVAWNPKSMSQHYSKSRIIIQKFNFDKNFRIFRHTWIFMPNIYIMTPKPQKQTHSVLPFIPLLTLWAYRNYWERLCFYRPNCCANTIPFINDNVYPTYLVTLKHLSNNFTGSHNCYVENQR